MQLKIFIIIILVLTVHNATAQVTGLHEDFNDNLLTGWQVPQTNGTFSLTESDGKLRIDYNRTSNSWEWDNFNYTPPAVIDASNNPYITVRAKSDVGTVLTFKPIYENGDDDWLQVSLPANNRWDVYKFELIGIKPYRINRIYMYLDGGTTENKSGVVFFDDLRIGDSVRTADVLESGEFLQLISDANTLYENSTEGPSEGQFPAGSRAELKAAIQSAENVLLRPDLTNSRIDSAAWELADACTNFETSVNAVDVRLTDPVATRETRYLYLNLDELSYDFLLFGMHDATGYGVGWSGDDDRSDVKDVCGSYPAVYSEDFNHIARGQDRSRMHYRLTSAYNRGGVITMAWHQFDPQGRSFYSSNVNHENIVATILPGGIYHDIYKEKLHTIAYFLKTLRGRHGESIPVIFRPYHEHTGGWFWWGAGECSREEYNAIWRFTVEYLRDSLNVHNLLYALSPSLTHLNDVDDYFTIYPGDEYVDIMGTDHYTGNPPDKTSYIRRLKDVITASNQRDKLIALTEIGNENLVDHDFFTDVVLNPILADTSLRKVSYAAVWRNQDEGHHFAPYPGHPSVPDFLKFYNDPYTLFEDDLPDMYSLGTQDDVPPEIISYPDSPFVAFDTLVTLRLKTNERAFLRYGFDDMAYENMPWEFSSGQGRFDHSTTIRGDQGQEFHLYIRAADYNGNATTTSIELSFTIDTLQRPLEWTDLRYDTSDWLTGAAPLHFGTGTTSGTGVEPCRTVYLRKIFQVDDPAALFQMVAFVKYDNGFVMYLNGSEVRRVNLSEGPVTYDTWAGSSSQTTTTLTLDASVMNLLRKGANVMAVEVHQSQNDSSDMNFDLKLINPDVVIDYGADWAVYSHQQQPPVKTLGATDIEPGSATLPAEIVLHQNYPNPFNPRTRISFAIPAAGQVDLTVFDLLGRRVATLLSGRMNPGHYSIDWDGQQMGSGIYFYRLVFNDQSRVRRMLLLR